MQWQLRGDRPIYQQLVEKHGKEAERKTIQDSISHPDASFKH